MLSCDDAGLVPEELLYLPREVFFVGTALPEQGLIRYNMRERFRQEMFRKVFGIKRSLMLKGNEYVMQRWHARSEVNLDAPAPPDLSRIPRRKTTGRKQHHNGEDGGSDNDSGGGARTEDEALDTESEDDGLDEYFHPKPPPPAPREPADDGTNTAASSVGGNPLDHSLALWANGTLRSSLTARSRRKQIAEPPPPSKPPIPHVPREPPRCRALSARHLQKEERHLELSRKRLAKYGTKVETAFQMTKERRRDISACSTTMVTTTQRESTSSPSPQRGGGGGALVVRDEGYLDSSVASLRLPRIPLSHLETKRQLAAMVRKTMVGIAESAIGFNTFRDDLDDQRDEQVAQESIRRSQNHHAVQGAHQSARRKREEEALRDQQRLKEEYEAYTLAKAAKTQAVLESKKQHHMLTNEVQRMRQMFANQKREWMHRREEARVNNILSRSEPKHHHAESFVEQRRMIADQRRQQHVQMELLRKELNQNVMLMNVRNEWEVPRVLEHLASRSSTRQSVTSDESPNAQQ